MKNLSRNVMFAALFVGILWGVFVVNLILPIELRNLGIVPRTASGALGILCAPFLHANFAHLTANSVAVFTLIAIALTFDFASGIVAMATIILIGGAGTWMFGAFNSIHMGASGLIFGLIGYLIFCGWYHRNIKSVVVSLLILVLYGGTLLSLLNIVPGISWTGQFFGFIGGICAARITKNITPNATMH